MNNTNISLQTLLEEGKYYLPSMPKEEQQYAVKALLLTLQALKQQDIDYASEREAYGFNLVNFLNIRASVLNNILCKQIDEIIHHPKFMDLESKWSGLIYLVKNCETGTSLKIKVLNVNKNSLLKDLTKSAWDASQLFKKVYESEMGTFGGEPFSVFVYDYYFKSNTADMDFIQRLSGVFAAAHAPCVSGVDAIMFNVDGFKKINQTRDISKLFQSKILWTSFRKTEDSRYMALVLPRLLSRTPYSVDNNPAEGVDYNETVDSENDDTFVWMNAAYSLCHKIAYAFSLYGWTAAIRGVEGGGLASDLPVYTYVKSEGDLAIKCPTEVSITDRREKELSDLGFICLCHCKGTNTAAFFSVQTCQMHESYENPNATANARMSTSLQYILIASRFAHYLKVMLRNKIGTFATAESIEKFLQSWIGQYILLSPNATQPMKAKMPLKGAKISVTETPGAVGVYNVILWISPHLQLDEISVSIRLVSKVPEK